ncbi:phage tail tape measure protein [Kaustia mangrovi]|uniref:Phage tail tape measure protein n=1 Tax=Kaustia mangrovi TaxID=2593653 RepID=A0A7S8C701_9HYPH|nr:phage tail tape measure protein [Kaustia mangrovi]QPC44529.1 phage tail tape measure protein [Kaustia mangrovi]
MANFDVGVTVRLIDRFKQPARALGGALGRLGDRFRSFGQSAGSAGREVDTFADRISTRFEKLQGTLGALGMSSLALGPMQQTGDAIMRAMRKPMAASESFEDRLIAFGNTAGIYGASLKTIEDRLDALGPATNRSAGELLEALEVLVAKGLEPDQALGALEAVGKGATATKARVEEMAAGSFAVLSNLKVPVEDLTAALDAMHLAGQRGGFELKNMAKEFPMLTAAAAGLKMRGVGAVADISAALQVALKGAGSPDIAANNMQNFMNKLTAPLTVKNFADFGVDLEKELAKAAERGISPIEHMLEVIQEVTGGDMFRVGEIFQDKQVREFLVPMLANMEEYRRIRDEAMAARGVIDEDYVRQVDNAAASTNRLANATERLQRSIGDAVNPDVASMKDRLAGWLDRVNALIESEPDAAKWIGRLSLFAGWVASLTAKIGSVAVGIAGFIAVMKMAFGFVPGARLLGSVLRGIGRGAGALARLGRAGFGGFFSGLAKGAKTAAAEVGPLSRKTGTLLGRFKGLLNVRNALKVGGALALGSAMVDDLTRSVDERLKASEASAARFKAAENALDDTAFGRAWSSLVEVADSLKARLGLADGEAPKRKMLEDVAQEVDQSRTVNQDVAISNNITVNARTDASPQAIGNAVARGAEDGTRRASGALHDGGAFGPAYQGAP